jgi:hypothetical protein
MRNKIEIIQEINNSKHLFNSIKYKVLVNDKAVYHIKSKDFNTIENHPIRKFEKWLLGEKSQSRSDITSNIADVRDLLRHIRFESLNLKQKFLYVLFKKFFGTYEAAPSH